MKIIASLVLFKHSYTDVQATLMALFAEESISVVAIVDNGGHCNWLDSLQHEKAKIIRTQENRGFGAGHNVVFQKYYDTAEYFLICNPDISFEKGAVDHLYAFSQREGAGLTVPKIVYPNGSHQYGCKLLPKPYQLFMRRFCSVLSPKMNHEYELRDADYSQEFFAPSLSGCFLLFSQQALTQTTGFDERFFLYMEDVDLSRRVCHTGLPVRYCPYVEVEHEAQSRSYRNIKFLIYHVTSAIRYFNKWGWLRDKERDKLNRECLSMLPYEKEYSK